MPRSLLVRTRCRSRSSGAERASAAGAPRPTSWCLWSCSARWPGATPQSDRDVDLLVIAEGLPRSLADATAPARSRPGSACGPPRTCPRSIGTSSCRHRSKPGRRRPLYLDMVEDAVLIADRDGFFEGVLAGMRERMRQLGSRRALPARRRLVLGLETRLSLRRSGRAMTTAQMGRRYIDEARGRVELVRLAFARALWATVVRDAQECVELFLKVRYGWRRSSRRAPTTSPSACAGKRNDSPAGRFPDRPSGRDLHRDGRRPRPRLLRRRTRADRAARPLR